MSRTRKRPRRGAAAVSKSCRNHGSCPRCASDRQHAAADLLGRIVNLEADNERIRAGRIARQDPFWNGVE